jgi:hypothetical protein
MKWPQGVWRAKRWQVEREDSNVKLRKEENIWEVGECIGTACVV